MMMGQLFLSATIAVLLFAGGYVSSVPFYGFDDITPALNPLSQLRVTHSKFRSPADDVVDAVITGDNSAAGTDAFFPGIFPSHHNPFFSNPMFSPFGNIDFGLEKTVPWWRGQNVCTDREETEDDGEGPVKDEGVKMSERDPFAPMQIFTGFQFSVNSCVEKPHKYTCKKIFSQNGKKKTLTIVRQCCQGYGRRPNADYTEHCEKIEMKSFEEAAEELNAKEFMRSIKKNDLESVVASNVTVFLPTDNAFTKFSEQMLENNLVYLPMGNRRRRAADQSGFTSKDLLQGHMVDGLIMMDDLANEDLLKTKLNNNSIRINIYTRPFGQPSLFTANCAPLVKLNQRITNGIIHSVNGVLQPVTHNLMDIIRKRSDMAVFKTVLEKTNLSKLLEGERPLTVFAPTDKAFEKLDMHLRRKMKEGKGCAENILKSHLLDFTYCMEAEATAPKRGPRPIPYNILGESLNFNITSNPKSELEIPEFVINGLVRVVERDIMGTNGVIHVVDNIFPSETSKLISSLMKEKNVTIFRTLMERAGLEAEFDEYDNATVFAPIDKSFEGSKWAKKLKDHPDQLKHDDELKEFLRGHVVHPKIKTCDLKEDLLKTVAGTNLRVNLYSTHAIFSNIMNRATVNCARLVHFDDEGCGSVLHQVEKQLENPKENLKQMLESNPEYSKFYEAVQMANLTDLLNDETESYTVFLPKNDVFEEFNIDVTKDKNLATMFVKEHMVNDVICCSGITATNWPFVRTIEALSGSRLRVDRNRRPKIDNATILKCDNLATNGIIHEMDDVILSKKPDHTAPVNRQNLKTYREFFF